MDARKLQIVILCLALGALGLVAVLLQARLHPPPPSRAAEALGPAKPNPTPSLAQLNAAVQARPENALARYNLAMALTQAQRGDEALDQFRQAVKLDPNFAAARNNLASMLVARGQAAEAEAHAREAVRLKPDSPEAHLNLANALFIQENLPEAESHYRTALSLKPGIAAIHLNLGKVLANQERLEEAVPCLEAAARLDSARAEPHQVLAKVHLALHRPKDAANEFSAALKLAPDWLEGLHSLAWLRAAHPDPDVRNGAEAMQLASRACQLTQSTNVPVLEAMAAAYAEAEMFEQARDLQRMACDLAKSDGWRHESRAANARFEGYVLRQPCRDAQVPAPAPPQP